MFFISAVVILVFLVGGVAFTDQFSAAMSGLLAGITTYFGWFYILSASFFVIFVLWLMFSRYGNLRLGPDSSRPEFGTMAWFAMLFTAGMGIGLVYYGVSEPVSNGSDPDFLNFMGLSEGDKPQRASEALNATLFHWGFHPWSIYIVLGLALGYFCFRKGLPMRPAAAFYPLIGNRIYGWIGYIVDVLAVFGTIFGLATSLGLGTGQINSGLTEITNGAIPNTPTTQILIVSLITAIAVASVMFGIDKGIRRLSVINLWLAAILMVFVFIVGPKLWILSSMADVSGTYLSSIVGDSFRLFDPMISSESSGATWQANWTLYYWGWWISWSPFVGMFLARISYGRTFRQFITGTLFAPVGASVVWFGVFGGSGLFYDVIQGNGSMSKTVGVWSEGKSEEGMFMLLGELPIHGVLATLLGIITVLVVVLFFATSSDSGSLVVDMLTNGGDPHPIKLQRFFWAVSEGLVTIVLLVVGGTQAVEALQAAALTTGLPFAVVLLIIAFALIKALREEDPASYLPSARVPRTTGGAPSRAAPPPGDTAAVGASSTGTAPVTSTDGNQ